MKFLRSLLAVVIGWVVSIIVISGLGFLNFVLYLPPGEKPVMETLKNLSEDPQAMKAWIDSRPADAMLVVLGAWQAGAFFGGLICALIAGRARVLHAGMIGIAVLAGTILNVLDMKNKYDFSQPDWMLLAGLLLPIPVSLLAGKLVAMIFPPAPVNPS